MKQQKHTVAHVSKLALATVLAMVGMVPDALFAQSGARGLEKIIVVAQRREQSLQEVPIAISALDAGSLEKLGISSAMDLRMSAPGLNFTQRTGSSLASIRGVSTPNPTPGYESSIAMYVDGVYYPSVSSNVILPASDGHSVKRVNYATEVNHDKGNRKEINHPATTRSGVPCRSIDLG